MNVLSFKNLEVKRITKGELPSLPFRDMKEKILGKDYELSLTFLPGSQIQKFSEKYKKSSDHKNVLSFPLDKDSGEILICLNSIRLEAKNFDRKPINHLAFIVIHSMLHLRGMTHGSKMESEEKRYMNLFGF